jgi:RNA polymerase sigma factor (sigma-70 family)
MGFVLEYVITKFFGIGKTEARSLADQVLISYVQHEASLSDVNAWMIASACVLARSYLERRGLTTGEEPKRERAAEQWLHEKEARDLLPARDRAVWRMRFEEGKTYAEIAAAFGVKVSTAKRMVSRAGTKLRALVKAREGRGATASSSEP